MYLKSLTIENFRKFRTQNNTVTFAAAKDYKTEEILNIAPKTTLIVGKNNSGKTTVIEALKRLLEPSRFQASDFNYTYLKEILSGYTPRRLASGKIEMPAMTFLLTIGIDADDPDLLTNLVPFITLGSAGNTEIVIKAIWAPEDDERFLAILRQYTENKKRYKKQAFHYFLDLINSSSLFALTYYNINGEKCESFRLKRLIELEAISAISITREDCLSNAFAKIVEFRYQHVKEGTPFTALDKEIVAINDKLTDYFEQEHTRQVNNSLQRIFTSEKYKVLLRSDLTFQKLLKMVLKYEYVEGGNHVPEQQFGLGYTNLMMIVADIIEYMEKYPDSSFNSQINLITIEEPETFMHPQMQELFIRDINQMIVALLEDHDKHINSQIIITTHSPHILNSKIHEGNSFNSINYITERDKSACAICLSDETIMPQNDGDPTPANLAALRYIKKHITFGVSELFFADAAVFVEGISEYVLLKHYISANEQLRQKYISLVLVSGAFSHVYRKLISILRIPVLIITDIDFERSVEEKKGRAQMTKTMLADRKTTNRALIDYYGTDSVEQIISGYYKDGRLMVVCQRQEIHGYYATSFEEAMILANPDNQQIKAVLSDLIPKVFTASTTGTELKDHSYHVQRSLSTKKSEFANSLLFEILSDETGKQPPDLPAYIQDGFDFLTHELGDN